MAKLYFRYGAMNSGKSTLLLQVAFNYEERGQRVVIAKPAIDSKGAAQIVSRLGMSRVADILIYPHDNLLEKFHEFAATPCAQAIAALLIDEAQFLSPAQIDQLMLIALKDNVPVLAYGLRSDFQGCGFPGSTRLLEIAHTLEELKTICRCGRKAIFNARKVGERFIFSGEQIAVDGDLVSYESLCGNCYLRESGGRLGAASSQH